MNAKRQHIIFDSDIECCSQDFKGMSYLTSKHDLIGEMSVYKVISGEGVKYLDWRLCTAFPSVFLLFMDWIFMHRFVGLCRHQSCCSWTNQLHRFTQSCNIWFNCACIVFARRKWYSLLWTNIARRTSCCRRLRDRWPYRLLTSQGWWFLVADRTSRTTDRCQSPGRWHELFVSRINRHIWRLALEINFLWNS